MCTCVEYVLILTMGNANGQTHISTNMSAIIVQAHTWLRNAVQNHWRVILLLLKNFFSKATMPVILVNMLPWLHRYPDQQTAIILLGVFFNDFVLPSLTGIGRHVFENLPLIYLHTDTVQEKILKEVNDGRIAGLFSRS